MSISEKLEWRHKQSMSVDAVVSPTCKSDFGFLFYSKLIHILKTRKCNFAFLSFALTYFIF